MWPAIALLFAVVIIGCARDYIAYHLLDVYTLSSWVVAALIYELFAYITCWALVLNKGKSDRAVWLNYIVWTLIAVIGNVSYILGL